MKIKEDYSYINSIDKKAMELKIAQLSAYQIRLDRYFSEEEKQQNREAAESLTSEEWGKRCFNTALNVANQNETVLNALENIIKIGQYKKDHDEDYDIWFWCNCGYNMRYHTHDNDRCLDYCTLTFREKISLQEQQELFNKIIETIKPIDTKNNVAIIQYSAVYDDEKLKEVAIKFAEENMNKIIVCGGKKGRIFFRNDEFIFAPLRVKKYWYQLSYKDLFVMSI